MRSFKVVAGLLLALSACGEGGMGGLSGVTPLATGTRVSGVMQETVSSGKNKSGDLVHMKVTSAVTNSGGKVIIPAGAIVTLSIRSIAKANQRGDKGTLVMDVKEIAIDGKTASLPATVSSYAYDMKARDIGVSEVARTAGGAAVGAVVGRVVGGGTGTVVGAVGGAAAGAAIAAKEQDHDIVVPSGGAVTLTLNGTFKGV